VTDYVAAACAESLLAAQEIRTGSLFYKKSAIENQFVKKL